MEQVYFWSTNIDVPYNQIDPCPCQAQLQGDCPGPISPTTNYDPQGGPPYINSFYMMTKWWQENVRQDKPDFMAKVMDLLHSRR